MPTFKINDFDRTEIKFVSKKMLPPFCKKPFLGRKKKKKAAFSKRNTLMKLQSLEKAAALKKCHQPLSWGSFRQFNEYKS